MKNNISAEKAQLILDNLSRFKFKLDKNILADGTGIVFVTQSNEVIRTPPDQSLIEEMLRIHNEILSLGIKNHFFTCIDMNGGPRKYDQRDFKRRFRLALNCSFVELLEPYGFLTQWKYEDRSLEKIKSAIRKSGLEESSFSLVEVYDWSFTLRLEDGISCSSKNLEELSLSITPYTVKAVSKSVFKSFLRDRCVLVGGYHPGDYFPGELQR